MPKEFRLLLNARVPLISCPQCTDTPFKPFMRGQVQRPRYEAPLTALTAWWEGRPFPYCALICSTCKNIVGWEAP